MKHYWIGTLLALSSGLAAAADPSRGELLYTTYCVACHTEQVHWRSKKLAKNWKSLVAQVSRWQEVDKRGWSDNEVEEVARYLNALHYGYKAPAP